MIILILCALILAGFFFILGYVVGKERGYREHRYDLHWISERKRNQWHELDKSTRRKN